MENVRSGLIISLNEILGIGLIRDSNNQKIRFYVNDTKEPTIKGDLVTFNINFRNWHLAATDISVLTSTKKHCNISLMALPNALGK